VQLCFLRTSRHACRIDPGRMMQHADERKKKHGPDRRRVPQIAANFRRSFMSSYGRLAIFRLKIFRSIGYRPRVFRTMLANSGPIAACNSLMACDKSPEGFLARRTHKRLDPTVETVVLRGPR